KADLSKLVEPDNYLLHPVLLDSCLQVLWAALPEATKEDTYLPVGIEKLIVHRYPDISSSCWSYAKISPESDLAGKILLADLYLLDEAGNCLVELKGVAIERASQEALLNSLQITQKIAIAASFTAEPIEDSLSFWMEELNLKSEIEFAPYNQIFQELLNPGSSMSQNRDGVNVILLRLEDWSQDKKQLKLIVDTEQKQAILGDLPTHNLPQGLEVAHLNQYETEYLYQELFVDRVYARHNIVLNDDACVVDIGANIGLFTLFIQQQCPNATIYSFEPAPHAFEKLKSNAALYCQNANLFNCGLSGSDKSETFTFYPNSSVFSGFHADKEDDEQAIRAVILNMLQQVNAGEGAELERLADEFMPGRLEVESFQAQLRTLSSVIEEHKIERIDLLKLDAEKSELPVLQGIKDHHWSIIQQMVVEVHDQEGSIIKQVKQLLQDKGFELIVEEETLLQGSGLYNIYATRPGTSAQVLSSISKENKASLKENIKDLGQALIASAESTATPYLVCLCPASSKVNSDPERSSFYGEMENLLGSYLDQVNGIHLLPVSELTTKYPVLDYYDPRGDKSGSVPYTPEYYTALGTAIARKINVLKTLPYKVIVLDCDRTLWNGICGEDGAEGVTIDPAYKKLQEFMVAQSEAGMLLCLCSKNNEADVWQVFDYHQMPLQRRHLVQWRINWQAKSENIKSLAQELNLGLDSFIFIDDNPLECAEVQANCPQVLTLQLPEQIDKIPNFLEHIWAFDHLQNTAEDKQRTALYQQNVKRESFRQETITFSDFLAGLNLQVNIAPMSVQQLARVAQLTQRTNQFNFTTIRRSETEIQQLLDSGIECLTVEVSDRFGDYGLVGAMLFGVSDKVLKVDTFLLSCRALGKGIEHQMLASLGTIAQDRGLEYIDLAYAATPKNQPALNFLENIEGVVQEKIESSWLFKLPSAIAAELTYNPETAKSVDSTPGVQPTATVSRGQKQIQTMTRIATELYEPKQILQLIESNKRRVRPLELASQFVAAGNQVEESLVTIWKEVLTIEQIGIQDNFFELGGTSLLMVQVLSKLQENYPQISLVDLYQ
ncbi:MAG: FkbM family methyltransferase, partial [Cyanobacteria bacterium J06642_3]